MRRGRHASQRVARPRLRLRCPRRPPGRHRRRVRPRRRPAHPGRRPSHRRRAARHRPQCHARPQPGRCCRRRRGRRQGAHELVRVCARSGPPGRRHGPPRRAGPRLPADHLSISRPPLPPRTPHRHRHRTRPSGQPCRAAPARHGTPVARHTPPGCPRRRPPRASSACLGEARGPGRASRSTSSAEVAHEWPRWYAANRAVIGGDPDRIQPGQRLTPPTGGVR